MPPAGVQASGREAAGFGEVTADGGPGRLAVRRDPRSVRPGASGKERHGVGESAAAGMHDEIDGAAAAGLRDVVEPAGTVDAEDGSGALPATRVAGVPAVAEALGKGFERLAADLVEAAVVPAPDHAWHLLQGGRGGRFR